MIERDKEPTQPQENRFGLRPDVTRDDVVEAFQTLYGHIKEDMKEGFVWQPPIANATDFMKVLNEVQDGITTGMVEMQKDVRPDKPVSHIVEKKLGDTTFFCRALTGERDRFTSERLFDKDAIQIRGHYQVDNPPEDPSRVLVDVEIYPESNRIWAMVSHNENIIAEREDVKSKENPDEIEVRKVGKIGADHLEGIEAEIAPGESPYPFVEKMLLDYPKAQIDNEKTTQTFDKIQEGGNKAKWMKDKSSET